MEDKDTKDEDKAVGEKGVITDRQRKWIAELGDLSHNERPEAESKIAAFEKRVSTVKLKST